MTYMIEGVLNIDKPLKMTSHGVVDRVRRLTGIRRVGHGGTLDPLASGVLVVALGRATRLLEYVAGQAKQYEARVHLGKISDTYDGEGHIVDGPAVEVSRREVEEALGQFRGAIRQIPPMHSALKKDGRPLYQLARQGVEVEREAREVTVYSLQIAEWDPPIVELKLACSTGTYVRSLAHDLGQVLGCGAYLAGLRRTAVGSFALQDAVSLDQLTSENVRSYLQSPDSAVWHLPRLEVSKEDARRLTNGQWLTGAGATVETEMARAYDSDGVFVGVVTRAGNRWRPRKIFYPQAEKS